MLCPESQNVKSRREALSFLGVLAAACGATLEHGPGPLLSTEHEALAAVDLPAALDALAARIRAAEPSRPRLTDAEVAALLPWTVEAHP